MEINANIPWKSSSKETCLSLPGSRIANPTNSGCWKSVGMGYARLESYDTDGRVSVCALNMCGRELAILNVNVEHLPF